MNLNDAAPSAQASTKIENDKQILLNEFKVMCAKKQLQIRRLELSRLNGLLALARKFDELGWNSDADEREIWKLDAIAHGEFSEVEAEMEAYRPRLQQAD